MAEWQLPEWELPLASACHVCRCCELYMRKIYILIMITGYIWKRGPCSTYGIVPLDNSISPTVKRYLFNDGASFTREVINNSRNVHTQSHDNPHKISATTVQRRFSVNLCCGLLSNKLIRSFAFDNNLVGNTYEVFLRKELPGLLEGMPLLIRSQM